MIKKIIHICLGTLVLAAGAWITIPAKGDIPITLQTFAMLILIRCMMPLECFGSVAVYIILGLFGVPVFSRFTGGTQVLMGPSGGYILGFLLMVPVFSLIGGLWIKPKHEEFEDLSRVFNIMTIGLRIFFGMLLAVVVCYLAGTIWYAKVYFNGDAALTLKEAAKVTVRPFIIPEIIKLIAGYFVSRFLYFWGNAIKYAFSREE